MVINLYMNIKTLQILELILNLMFLISQGPASEGPAVCICSSMFYLVLKHCGNTHTWLTNAGAAVVIAVCMSDRDHQGNQEPQEMKETSGLRSVSSVRAQDFLIWIDVDMDLYGNI